MSNQKSIGKQSNLLRIVAAFLAFGGIIFAFAPIYPGFPAFSLDSSWQYAMNEAVARNFVIGKDILFTMGPLTSVYSHIYHPATDAAMLWFSVFLASAFFVGCLSLARGSFLILLIPFAIPQTGLYDPFFLCLPLLFVLVAIEWTQSVKPLRNWLAAALAILAAALSILPLVKASFLFPVAVSAVIAVAVVGRKSGGLAALYVVFAILLNFTTWAALGQPVGGFVRYYLSQLPIISGFNDGMSTLGPVWQTAAFLVAALIILVLLLRSRRYGSSTWIAALSLAIIFYVAYKAGFVRHDGHARTAGSTLLLTSCILVLALRSRLSIAIFVVGMLAWATVNYAHMSVDPISMSSRLTAVWTRSWTGLRVRASGSDEFEKRFQSARAKIVAELPLPPSDSTVDLYPFDISAVLASGQRWAPRPVLQTYSAYTPALAELDRAHLASKNAADRIYFSISAIDEHYPSLEDGTSWPELISRYRVTALFGQYAVLEKRSVAEKIAFSEPVVDQRDTPLGQQVALPQTTAPLWAKIVIRPTLMGRLVSFLYKLPALNLVVLYPTGVAEHYRYVPGYGVSGFLLSPTVHSAFDFAALQSTRRDDLLGARKPVSIGIQGDSGTSWLWRNTYSLQVSELQFHMDDKVGGQLFAKAVPVPNEIEPGGVCNVDAINGVERTEKPSLLSRNTFSVMGWGAVSPTEGIGNDRVFVSIRGSDGNAEMIEAKKIPRNDVNSHFKQPSMGNVGYEVVVDAADLHGRYNVGVVQKTGGRYFECPVHAIVETRDYRPPSLFSPTANLPPVRDTGGECSVDEINGSPYQPGRNISLKNGANTIKGWAVYAGGAGVPNERVFVEITRRDGSVQVIEAEKTERRDVNEHFQNTGSGRSGFSATVDGVTLTGPSKIQIVQLSKGRYARCPVVASLIGG
ncbi:hypothetical protein [Caballeronia telluris]|nr:hypothetical protein [Caballeronia telluris]